MRTVESVCTDDDVVKLHVTGLASGVPSDAFAPVLTVAVYVEDVASAAVGVSVAVVVLAL